MYAYVQYVPIAVTAVLTESVNSPMMNKCRMGKQTATGFPSWILNITYYIKWAPFVCEMFRETMRTNGDDKKLVLLRLLL